MGLYLLTTGRQRGSGSTFVLGLMAVLLLLVFGLYIYQLRIISYVKDVTDDGLTLALLGGAVINVQEYGRTRQTVIHDTVQEKDIYHSDSNGRVEDTCLDGSYQAFYSCLTQNLGLNAEGESDNSYLRGPVRVEEYKVFNVYRLYGKDGNVLEKQIYEFTCRDGQWSVLCHAPGEAVFAAGSGRSEGERIPIKDTTVYARLSFQLDLFPAAHEGKLPISLQRCVSVPLRE